MYHKRLRTYRHIGFEICSHVADSQVVENSIFDWQNYQEVFGGDVASAKADLVISSPGLGSRKVWKFIKDVIPLQESGVRIAVRSVEKCREHFAVIDNSIVWYGSINLLSREKEDDSMMRIENPSIAQELLLKLVEKFLGPTLFSRPLCLVLWDMTRVSSAKRKPLRLWKNSRHKCHCFQSCKIIADRYGTDMVPLQMIGISHVEPS